MDLFIGRAYITSATEILRTSMSSLSAKQKEPLRLMSEEWPVDFLLNNHPISVVYLAANLPV